MTTLQGSACSLFSREFLNRGSAPWATLAGLR